ncbi:thioredoxin reductase [Spiroplasma corruscae]|uniref:Ferredoxin--NADP reductase n=1 Tax=Spiroplasma corruscae TaxID=216934 RepID=A0A222EQY9_9MOLU|nr:NAD(P)/FAD-dependent oxidoreductase [Spiroplasma corruscae]ASP28653.1 thioredoxin reductase [Spiroplasma corruscae]
MIKDLLIVGCGPGGLYAWKIAQKYELSGDIVEAKDSYGGQVSNLYPSKEIHNLPAILSITGKEAMDAMFESIDKTKNNIKSHFKTNVKNIKIVNNKELGIDLFEVTLSNDKTFFYKTILFTEGLGSYLPIKLFEKDYKNVFYKIDDINYYKDKNVLVFGGGDSAIDAANQLIGTAKSIKIIHRRNEFRGLKANLRDSINKGVEIITPYTYENIIEEDDNSIKKIILKNVEDDRKLEVELDFAIIFYGSSNQSFDFKNIKINKDDKNKIIVDSKMQSSIKNIFAAGDCCVHESKIKNLVATVYEALTAIINIDKVINAKDEVHRGW